MSDGLPKYFTADDVARILEVDRYRVWSWRREGLVREALKAGQMQFDRAGLARIAVLVGLQEIMGLKSEVPARLVREHAEVIDHLLDDLERDREFRLQIDGSLSTAIIRVPLVVALRDAIKETPS